MNIKQKIGLCIFIILIIICSVFAYREANMQILQGEVEVKTVDLSSKVAGRVEKINFKEGDRVKSGDVIIELETPEIEAKMEQANAALQMSLSQQQKVNNGARNEQIAMAKASMEVAKKTYDRLSRLHNEGVIPTQKLDEAYAKYIAAKEQYNMLVTGSRIEDKLSAQALVEKAKGANSEVEAFLKENKITAVSDGIITEIMPEEGELVGAGFPLVSIIDDNDSWVTFNLREDLLPKIKVGTEFKVKIPAIGKEAVNVKVTYISALGNFANWRATKARGDFDMKTFEVRAVPTENVEGLRAGMSAVFDYKKLK
ncbi:HlyD family secretion protein [bacterium]|nr:HlyD family secretion protein [bacterium]